MVAMALGEVRGGPGPRPADRALAKTWNRCPEDAAEAAGLAWVGINGGFDEDYVDSQGRLWHHTHEAWTPTNWGGWMGSEPRDYSNSWGSPRMKCKTWPADYDQDYEALLHHYSIEHGTNQTFRVYNFCEKQWHGGGKMDIVINGKVVKKDYITKCHHTRTDIYHFKCIPTLAGVIEVSIQGDPEVKGGQARFSTLEFEKSSEACGGACESVASCGKGFCSSTTFYDYSSRCDFGSEGMVNEFDLEEALEAAASCKCDADVQGEACELGACAAVSCNEPFGGFCLEGKCQCIDGHTGENCEVAPDIDRFGCYAQHEEVSEFLTVSTVCLPELIAGPARHGHIFRGPSPMNAVADKTQPNIYFSWTADLDYGKAASAGDEGRVYVSKLRLPSQKGQPVLLAESEAFDGFARAGGIDMTEDGQVGTLCAKYWHPWVENTGKGVHNAAMVLAVCELNTTSMTKKKPWQIGKQYQAEETAPNTGIWGSLPLSAWFAQRSAGYGYLVYSPAHRSWTAWYGATVGSHTGFAMHTYHRDAPAISAEDYEKYTYPVPRDQLELRSEASGPWRDHHRTGTGDHQASAALSYHPKLQDIGLQKHTHGAVYMQQYGLSATEGAFAPPGHKTGRLELSVGNDTGLQANALRPCGEGWLVGIIADSGNVCAKVSRLGEILLWKVIEASVGKMPCGSSGKNCGDQAPGRMLRLAHLGVDSDSSNCGPEQRFLMGFEKLDKSRWLVELDGDCNEVSERSDVTQHTHWPLYQDWTTTAEGAVAWVTSWHIDREGRWGPAGSPNGVWPYDPKPMNEDAHEESPETPLFGPTPDATNAAKITVYYPRSMATKSSTTSTAMTTTVSASTSSSSTGDGFEEVDGLGRACRGAHENDNSGSHYQVVASGSGSLEACKQACLLEPLCSGLEFSSGRCEVWTRPGGIRATKALDNFRCLRYEPPGASSFQPMDGGLGRTCRGANANDNSPSYYSIHENVDSLFECKALCLKNAECKGIEYGFLLRRCEVWTRAVQATESVEGFACWARDTGFQFVNGGDQACRGAHSKDNSANYYTVVREQSLDACKLACTGRTDCVGIEYSAGRCEVWTRPEGIQATFPLKGFSCLRYQPSASTATALVQKKSRSRSRHFLGPAFLQTGYQPSVTEFTETEGAATEL
ncbi:unnamed protein product [Symbiodinium sp. CCMP2456]|nr:unnamed protein product [Symbiodinium sp. CCMP2456]